MSRLFNGGETAQVSRSNVEEHATFGKKVRESQDDLMADSAAFSTAQTFEIHKPRDLAPEDHLPFFLNRLADLLVQPSEKFPPQERALIDDLAARVTKLVSTKGLVALSERLIKHHSMPSALVHALLLGEEEVALPLLSSQMHFNESDLIAVVKAKGEAHQVAIAKRENLPPGVCDAVVSHGCEAALRKMLKNFSSRISRPAYVLLSQRSLTDPSLLDLLIERQTFPADIAHLVFWWCKPKVRKRIIERFSCQRDAIREIVPEEVLQGLREQGGAPSYAARMIQKPEKMPKDDIARALEALKVGASDEVLALLSEGGGVKEETVAQILDDAGSEAVAVLAKACGFGRMNFFRLREILSELKDTEWNEEEAQNDIATIIHDTLSTDRADVVLRYWDRTSREVTE